METFLYRNRRFVLRSRLLANVFVHNSVVCFLLYQAMNWKRH